VCLACAPIATAGPGCTAVAGPFTLPPALRETSGIAVGIRDPTVLWTHTDDGAGLWAIDRAGAVIAAMAVRAPLQDWEDIEVAPCAVAGSCVYIADTGDNGERREDGSATVVRVAEPAPEAGKELPAEVFPILVPDGPRDVEALFVLPGERVHLITKGRQHAVTVYRYPGPLRSDTVTLVEVQRLTSGPQALLSQVTGASASRDGSVVGVRTYQALQFYRVDADTLAPMRAGLVNLRPLEEIQGEGVGLGADGFVVLTSEGGPFGGPGSLRVLRCAVEG
jgi:hypothetical protein